VKRSGAPSIGDIVKYKNHDGPEELNCTALIIKEHGTRIQILPLLKPGDCIGAQLLAFSTQGGWIRRGEIWVQRAKCEVLNLNNRNY